MKTRLSITISANLLIQDQQWDSLNLIYKNIIRSPRCSKIYSVYTEEPRYPPYGTDYGRGMTIKVAS